MYKSNIHESGTQLSFKEFVALKGRVDSMENKFRLFFNENPHLLFSAEDMHNIFGGLLSSVRRSLSNLKNENYLIKDVEHKKRGSHEIRIVTYKLK